MRSEGVNQHLSLEGEIVRCFQCGSCTSSCTTNSVMPEYNPRRSIEMAVVSGVIPTSEEAWSCSTCANCVERCPRGVSAMDVMLSARKLLLEKNGEIPGDRKVMIGNIMSTGLAFNSADQLDEIRRTLGLPEVSLDVESLKQIRDLVEQSDSLKSLKSQVTGGGAE
jgi:heterodisulfide reductase subunit C